MSFLEPVAALLGVLSVGLIIRRSLWAFPIGIVMVALYALVFYRARLYSDMLLQFAFIALQVHGWYRWAYSPVRDNDRRVRIRRLSVAQWVLTAGLFSAGTLALGGLMKHYTNAAIPFLDAGTTTASLLAQWWMNNRYIDNWLLWMLVDAVYLYQYSSQSLYFTTALYAVFLGMAVWGWRTWQGKLR